MTDAAVVHLPVVRRTEFGYGRTRCACEECTLNCEHIPGYLIPSDLPRLAGTDDEADILAWAASNLLASPGALVARPDGSTYRIRTLVPARAEAGRPQYDGGAPRTANTCRFFDVPTRRCTVHESAPFGCAFFDSHMSMETANERSSAGLRAIQADAAGGGIYLQAWHALDVAGARAQSAEAGRKSLMKVAGPQRAKPKVGRNEPCPCGSGKKNKRCCGSGAA